MMNPRAKIKCQKIKNNINGNDTQVKENIKGTIPQVKKDIKSIKETNPK
jgi:hypothetical protein